ncbi:hypothetical protein ACW73L_19820 [Methylolobus aquaticus]
MRLAVSQRQSAAPAKDEPLHASSKFKEHSMRFTLSQISAVLLLGSVASVGFAGGRYTNPPVGLVETQEACAKGLEAAEKGDTATALEMAKKGRKIALESYKEISTMPMEIGSSTMKKAIISLEEGKVAESVEHFKHCKEKMDSEIDYYKKEGKL